jgi:hypothetical protein
MTKKELGLAAYQIIAAQVKDQGGSLTPEGMPKKYPISLRQIDYIKTGFFRPLILAKVGIEVQEDYKIKHHG